VQEALLPEVLVGCKGELAPYPEHRTYLQKIEDIDQAVMMKTGELYAKKSGRDDKKQVNFMP
jgi:hypothetical protein